MPLTGALSLAFDGVVLFAGAQRGHCLQRGHRRPACGTGGPGCRKALTVGRRLYLLVGNALVGVDPVTGGQAGEGAGANAASAGLYGVRAGAVLGIDHGALGKAWGYNVATQRVLWTSNPLPWPHYFVDPSGIGGSTSPGIGGLLLAVCAELGTPVAWGAPQPCLRPELTALNR